MRLGQAKTQDGMRLYAIGDVHGCHAMLADVHQRIASDIAASPAIDHRIIHIGDYADRGPDSAAVIARLVTLTAGDEHVICLLGNHDQMLADFLAEPTVGGGTFLAIGGGETLASYGIAPGSPPTRREGYVDLARQLAERMPDTHRSFIDKLQLSVRFGDYFFCHAGIRPGVQLDEQDAEDLLWIREEFLSDRREHGMVVVHGHTPVSRPQVLSNRINIDTGAVYGGSLTCLVLDGRDYRFL